jgi:hypothetical protein
MPRQLKLGRPKKHRGRKPGSPTKWTVDKIAVLADDARSALQSLEDAAWADRKGGPFVKPLKVSGAKSDRAELAERWQSFAAQQKPKKVSAKRLAERIKELEGRGLTQGKYPSAEQLRKLLTTYRVNLVALNDAYWLAILAAGEPTSKLPWKKPKVTPFINRAQLDEADRIFELSKRQPPCTGIFRRGKEWYVQINLGPTAPRRIHGPFASRKDALAKLNYWKQLLENGEK